MTGRARHRWYLREWRKHRGLTIERLAELIETTKSVVSELEVGKKRYNQDHLEKLADALGCEPADLLTRDPSDPEGVWEAWDHVPVSKRDDAIRVLRALADEHGTTPKPRRKPG